MGRLAGTAGSGLGAWSGTGFIPAGSSGKEEGPAQRELQQAQRTIIV